MAQRTFVEGEEQPGERPRPSGTAILWASLAGIAVGGPLLGMMGFTLMATLALLFVASPFLFISSPLLLSAVLVLAASMAGFAAAAAMAFVGVSAFAWAVRAVRGRGGAAVGTLTESGQRVKERGMDLGDYLERKVLVQPPESKTNQG